MGSSPSTSSIDFELVNGTIKTKTFKWVIDTYHSYINHTETCNRRLNWLIYVGGDLAGAIGINSAYMQLGPRDEFVSWDKETRLAHLNSVANNYRFCLIEPSSGLGSRVLAALDAVARRAWKDSYGDRLALLETLVKPPWDGAVYKAAGWLYAGMTKGYSFSKAPLRAWQREDSPRGELARRDPDAAVAKYAAHGTGKLMSVTKSDPKLVFLHPVNHAWRRYLGVTA